MSRRHCNHHRHGHRHHHHHQHGQCRHNTTSSSSLISSDDEATYSPHVGYRLYYIDLFRYLLYISAFFILFNSFELYADDFLELYRMDKKSTVPTSTFLFLVGSVMAVGMIYLFRFDGLIYKLFIFISLISSILFGRWLLAPKFSGDSVVRLIPYYFGLFISFIIIIMVIFELNDLTIGFGGEQQKHKPIKHCHHHKNNDLSDVEKNNNTNSSRSKHHFHNHHHHHRHNCRSRNRQNRRTTKTTTTATKQRSLTDSGKEILSDEKITASEMSNKITSDDSQSKETIK
ncbi:hypothetical protein DERF_009638 [Dermatophagoides farinae]|uniref:Uncharacterized protein n=1 Tax=Dermatophagoides farinae TaxID=6954 RepID=A0A922HXC2_DERFA|nr:hypothetical protein DERF_009638 [Dermatophagoides farinae]